MRFLLLLAALLVPGLAQAGPIAPREGWSIQATPHSYERLIERVKEATLANGMGVVTEAGPTKVAAKRGIEIPGNRVIGIFNNDIAVRTLALSTAAMIEAPIRLYVTDNGDGSATLSYKLPSHVFAPYVEEAGDALVTIAADLDARFATIATAAVAPE
ncbi:MAG: DUF302 domain-containing protein [Pseudomonadota bacterium]